MNHRRQFVIHSMKGQNPTQLDVRSTRPIYRAIHMRRMKNRIRIFRRLQNFFVHAFVPRTVFTLTAWSVDHNLAAGRPRFLACTPLGVLQLLQRNGIATAGKLAAADWLTLLVQSEVGYRNLMRLVSRDLDRAKLPLSQAAE